MNLTQLRTFELVARTGSLSAAARMLGVSQPAVSGHVARLEREHATALFERVRRRLVLTAAGRGLLEDVRHVFTVLGEAEERLSEARGLRRGLLRLAASLTSAAYDAPDLVIAFRQRFPGVVVQLSVENSSRVVERIVNLEADVGVVGAEARHPEIARQPLFLDPLVLVVPPRHALARRRTVTVTRLAQEPLLVREAGSATRTLIEQQFAAHGVAVNIAMEIASNEAIKRMAALGQGMGILSRRIVTDDLQTGRVGAVEICTASGRPIRRRVDLIHHFDRRDALVVRAVLDVVARLHDTRRWRAVSVGSGAG